MSVAEVDIRQKVTQWLEYADEDLRLAKHPLRSIALSVISLFMNGCASFPRDLPPRKPESPVVAVSIDGLAQPHCPPIRSFVLVPHDKKTDIDDLQFREFAAYVERTLLIQFPGAKRIVDNQSADVAIAVDYSISDPNRNTMNIQTPVYGQVGIQSSSTYGSAYSTGGQTNLSAHTINVPQYGVVGYENEPLVITTYVRTVSLNAFDLANEGKPNSASPRKIWQTTITSTGRTGDL
jgi:hypothetical protein